MEEPKRCWRLRHHDGFRSGFPHLGTTSGHWVSLYGRTFCILYGVERRAWCPPADARSIPCCAIQKPSLGIFPYPLEEEVTVTPVKDDLWKGRQDGVWEEVLKTRVGLWVVYKTPGIVLKPSAEPSMGVPSDRSWEVSCRCFDLPNCWTSPFPWKAR